MHQLLQFAQQHNRKLWKEEIMMKPGDKNIMLK
jgi:hypothetical protein